MKGDAGSKQNSPIEDTKAVLSYAIYGVHCQAAVNHLFPRRETGKRYWGLQALIGTLVSLPLWAANVPASSALDARSLLMFWQAQGWMFLLRCLTRFSPSKRTIHTYDIGRTVFCKTINIPLEWGASAAIGAAFYAFEARSIGLYLMVMPVFSATQLLLVGARVERITDNARDGRLEGQMIGRAIQEGEVQ